MPPGSEALNDLSIDDTTRAGSGDSDWLLDDSTPAGSKSVGVLNKSSPLALTAAVLADRCKGGAAAIAETLNERVANNKRKLRDGNAAAALCQIGGTAECELRLMLECSAEAKERMADGKAQDQELYDLLLQEIPAGSNGSTAARVQPMDDLPFLNAL